jgi:hypothetical protein
MRGCATLTCQFCDKSAHLFTFCEAWACRSCLQQYGYDSDEDVVRPHYNMAPIEDYYYNGEWSVEVKIRKVKVLIEELESDSSNLALGIAANKIFQLEFKKSEEGQPVPKIYGKRKWVVEIL